MCKISSYLFIRAIHLNRIELENGSVLKNYLDAAKGKSPAERGKLLEDDAAFTEDHQQLAAEGQSELLPEVNHHFIAYVNHKDVLYELDGRRPFPIPHGSTSADTFLKVILR